jgi:hypothetical protein
MNENIRELKIIAAIICIIFVLYLCARIYDSHISGNRGYIDAYRLRRLRENIQENKGKIEGLSIQSATKERWRLISTFAPDKVVSTTCELYIVYVPHMIYAVDIPKENWNADEVIQSIIKDGYIYPQLYHPKYKVYTHTVISDTVEPDNAALE